MSNWQQVGGNTAVRDDREVIYPKYKELFEAGVPDDGIIIAEGIFTGSYEGKNQFGKEFTTYYIDCGTNKVGLDGAGNLGYLMTKAELVPNVSKIRVTYLGKSPMTKGAYKGTLAHSFGLEVDATADSVE